MKKIFLLLALITLLYNGSYAGEPKPGKPGEQWIICGMRGIVHSSWLLNSNQLKDDGVKYMLSWGGGGGLMLGYHIGEVFSINFEGLYSGYSQKREISDSLTSFYSKTKLGYLEFPVLLHFDFDNFKYAEVGVKFSGLKKASYDSDAAGFTGIDNYKNYFEKNNVSLILGWGKMMFGSNWCVGFRLTYGLSDIISKDGGKGNDYLPVAGGAPVAYKKTNIATFGVCLSGDFDLGSFMSSSCNRNHKFVFFKR